MESFDVDLLTLEYEGQRIDLGSSDNANIYNPITKEWQVCETHYSNFTEHIVYGLTIPVITWQELVEYKEIIRRPTDLENVAAIVKNFHLK